MQSVAVAPELFQPQHGGRVAAAAWRKKGSVLEVKASGAMKFSLAVGRKSALVKVECTSDSESKTQLLIQ